MSSYFMSAYTPCYSLNNIFSLRAGYSVGKLRLINKGMILGEFIENIK